MVGTGGGQGAAELERVAREAEEARRREIMAKIQQLEGEISGCQVLIASFRDLEEQVGRLISLVNEYKIMNLEADMNAFSGITASAVNEGLADVRYGMEERSGDFSNAEAAVGTQIGLLESYKIGLESRINSLRAEL